MPKSPRITARPQIRNWLLTTALLLLLPLHPPVSAGQEASTSQEAGNDVRDQVLAELQRIASSEDQVRYRGQYSSLKPLGHPAAQILLELLTDEDQPIPMRRRAANALQDVATPELLPPLGKTLQDLLLEPWIETEVVLLMARLGERKTLDGWIQKLRRSTDRVPTTVTLAEILEDLRRIGDLQFRSDDLAGATATHRRRIALLKDLIPRLSPHLRTALNDEMRSIHYNLACCLALSGQVELAFDAVEQSLLASTINIAMVEVDGDLKVLRNDPRWSEWLQRHKNPQVIEEPRTKEKQR